MKKLLVAGTVVGIALVGGAPAALASPPPDHKVTYCHATHSETNPYVLVTTDEVAVVKGHKNHQGTEDVIPPFDWALPNSSGHFPGQNFGPGAAEFIENGCTANPDPYPVS